MRVMFVYAGFENLGIEYLSAVLKEKGHKTKLAFDPRLFNDQFISINFLGKLFNYEKQLIKEVLDYKPDLVNFSVVSSDYLWSLRIASKIKEKLDVPIIFGGTHPTAVPEVVIKNKCVDYVSVGEGECALLELVEKLAAGKNTDKIKNIWCKKKGKIIKNSLRPLIQDLDKLPFPDKDLFYNAIQKYKRGYIIVTRRGCPNRCSYCHNSLLRRLYPNEGMVRFRSVDNVIEELKLAKRKYKIKSVRVNDDLFSYNEKWLMEFSKRYKNEIALPIYCSVSPDTTNENVVRYLKEMGCYQVCMGVQSVNEDVRKNILHRGSTNDDIKNAINLYKKYKIRCVVDHILGLPGETEEHILDTVRFYNENRGWGRVAIFWLIYFPNTDMVKIGLDKGVLTEEMIRELKERPYFIANTLQSSLHERKKLRYHWLLLMVHFLPKKTINYIINKKLYRYFPKISPAILEIPFTMFSKDRYDIPRSRYYIRYLSYISKMIKSGFIQKRKI